MGRAARLPTGFEPLPLFGRHEVADSSLRGPERRPVQQKELYSDLERSIVMNPSEVPHFGDELERLV